MVLESAANDLPSDLKTAALDGRLGVVKLAYTSLLDSTTQDKNHVLLGIAECAALKSHLDMLEWCFTTGLRISPDMMNSTLYHNAMDSRSKSVWGLLTSHGLDLNLTFSEFSGDVFSEAVREGDVDLVRFLLEQCGQDPNRAGGSEYYGFCEVGACAVVGDHPSRATEILRLMLQHGWVSNKPSKYQCGAAHIVAAQVGHMEALRVLVEHGSADLELTGSMNFWDDQDAGAVLSADQSVTALFAAVSSGHEDAVAYLLERGADPSFKDGEGRSCLRAAREQGNERITGMLEGNGAAE